jgi:flagellar hook protein FlgE
MDVDGSGTQNEPVYRIHNDATNSGAMYIDLGQDGAYAAATDQLVSPTNTATDLSAFEDNAIVHTDSSGNQYRKVPYVYDKDHRSVYLDKNNKGVYDEVQFNILQAGDATTQNLWVIDDNNDGVVTAQDATVLSTLANTDTSFTAATATFDRPNSTSINGLSSGSGRLQVRGNIGTVNELSDVSFISGVDKVERNIFGASALADTIGASASVVSSANGESVSQNIVVYDSLGQSHDVNMTFVLEAKDNDKATWRWFAETADVTRKNGIFPVGDPRGNAPSMNVGSGTVSFDNFGRFLSAQGATQNSEALIAIPLEGSNTDSTLNIKPDFSILTAFASSAGSQVDVREQDGFAQGVMDRYTVNADGTVTGIYTNGMTETVAQIALAAFANPDGLTRAGGNLFMVGSNSGNAMIGEAMTGERGAIRGEALEQSNVDITDEFTNMISTQRAYQASARVVTKADELLQELMQIIR